MTKRHFQLLAEALKAEKPVIRTGRSNDLIRLEVWDDCCNAVARACANMNPSFNRERFLLACGMED